MNERTTHGTPTEASRYTPGPWKATGPSQRGNYFRVRGTRLGQKWRIADSHYTSDAYSGEKNEAEANALLIAAAPELLESAKYLLWLADTAGHGSQRVELARSIIAKATGGEPANTALNSSPEK